MREICDEPTVIVLRDYLHSTTSFPYLAHGVLVLLPDFREAFEERFLLKAEAALEVGIGFTEVVLELFNPPLEFLDPGNVVDILF